MTHGTNVIENIARIVKGALYKLLSIKFIVTSKDSDESSFLQWFCITGEARGALSSLSK